MKFGAPSSYGSGEDFFRHLVDSFDQLHEEGAEAPKMLSVGLHQRLVGRPGRARALARFLDHVAAHDGAWVCRRIDIARHWHANHQPAIQPAAGHTPAGHAPAAHTPAAHTPTDPRDR